METSIYRSSFGCTPSGASTPCRSDSSRTRTITEQPHSGLEAGRYDADQAAASVREVRHGKEDGRLTNLCQAQAVCSSEIRHGTCDQGSNPYLTVCSSNGCCRSKDDQQDEGCHRREEQRRFLKDQKQSPHRGGPHPDLSPDAPWCQRRLRVRLLILLGLIIWPVLPALPQSQAQHVVIEDIGKFAGATSYIHVVLHLDLMDLHNHINKYEAEIN